MKTILSRPSLVCVLVSCAVFLSAPARAAEPKDGNAAPKTAPSEPAPPGGPKDETKPAPGGASRDGEYIEYRYLPELGQIIFSDNSVRGAKRVAYLKEHAADLAAKGIYAVADEAKRHVYRQSQQAGERVIESVIVIDPPTHQGDNGDAFTTRLVVKIDGRRKIDCTLGSTPDGELWVHKIVIHPDDGSVEIRALSGDGEELSIPEAQESLDRPGVITDDSFYEDDPEEPGKGPVKA